MSLLRATHGLYTDRRRGAGTEVLTQAMPVGWASRGLISAGQTTVAPVVEFLGFLPQLAIPTLRLLPIPRLQIAPIRSRLEV